MIKSKRKLINLTVSFIFLAAAVLSLSSCFLFGTAAAEVAFENVSYNGSGSKSAYTLTGPEVFDIKIAAIYLSENIDPVTKNNSGLTPMIYLNPACNGNVESYNINNLEFFNFARSSAEVNAQINAKAEPIPAHTYRYIRIEFFKNLPEQCNNMRWGTGKFTLESSYGEGNRTVEFAEPLVVRDGQQVRVTLEYDLSDTIAVIDTLNPEYPPDFHTDDWYEDNTHIYEFRLPEFNPKAEVVP